MNDDCKECSYSPFIHDFYIKGGNFKFTFPPRVNFGYQVARNSPQFGIGFNRYPHNIIGAYVSVFGYCFVLNWKK